MERVVQDMRNESTIHSSAWELTGCRSPIQTPPMVLLMGAWVITQSGRGGKVSLLSPTTPLISDPSYKLFLKTKTFPNIKCTVKYNMWNGMLNMCPCFFQNTRCGWNTWSATFSENVASCLDSSCCGHWQNKHESRRENCKSDYQQVLARAILTACLQRQRAFLEIGCF